MVIIVRGAGDIASGIIYRLYKAGFKILALEVENPSCIRRTVSFAEAVYTKEIEIEGIVGVRCETIEEIYKSWRENKIPIYVDKQGKIIDKIDPVIVIDAILAKKNIGNRIVEGRYLIGVGPGFIAGKDVDCVIETMRGHNLGRVIYSGEALRNTGIPGEILGIGKDRVIYSFKDGIFISKKKIGDFVEKGESIGKIDGENIYATISGLLRGIIRDGYKVDKNMKIADIDPRLSELKNCFTISDKALAIGGGVLEAVLFYLSKKGENIWS